jgi:hypothetical protein
MGYKTRFSDIDDLGPDGYEEMSKGIVQIWRHVYHSRIGKAKPPVPRNAVGLVLTLDSWFQAGMKRQSLVIEEAKKLMHQKCPESTVEDQIPVAFSTMTEFENVLRTGTPSSIIDVLKTASSPEKRGWSIDAIHSSFDVEREPFAGFPFAAQLAEILPMWGDLMDRSLEASSEK